MRLKKAIAMLLTMLIIAISLQQILVFGQTELKTVRVGFFEFDGYHNIDSSGNRSGYGYEYLHEMAKYTNWTFEYVTGTWEECQNMLERGEIDLLTSAQYNESRANMFDFSSTSMGTSYAQLSVEKNDARFAKGDYTSFDGIKVGLLDGNSRNAMFEEFALKEGFSYDSVVYDTQDQLDEALCLGKVDAVLTSSLRKPDNERIIAQFNPSPFYCIVRKGNNELLNEINHALTQIEMNNPAFRYNLYNKFYRIGSTNLFSPTKEEQAYLDSNPVIRAGVRPNSAPLSSWENGSYEGITADYMNYLFQDLGMDIEYVNAPTTKDSMDMLAKGEVDILCTIESDYNLAEKYNARITTSYLNSSFSAVTRKNNTSGIHTVALIDGSMFGDRYASENYPQAKRYRVKSSREAVNAVADGKADIAFINTYTADYLLVENSSLKAHYIADMFQPFSIAVNRDTSPELYSILDKKINSFSSELMNGIIFDNTVLQERPITFLQFVRQNTIFVIGALLVLFFIIMMIMLYILRSKRRHEEHVFNLAYIDSMTGLWNNNGYLMRAQEVVNSCRDVKFATVRLDLARFSDINEHYGRAFGDKVIAAMSQILNRMHEEQIVTARVFADAFMILMPYNQTEELCTALENLAGVLTNYEIEGFKLNSSVNIGVGFVTDREDGLIVSVDHSKAAHNESKSTQKTVVIYSSALHERMMREKTIIDGVARAISENELTVYFQPKYDMRIGSIIGAEALIRWKHPELGFLSPDEFIPILERNGKIIEVDFYVLECVCKILQDRINKGLPNIILSVNQSRAHFQKNNYIERLQDMLIKYNLQRDIVELEITETVFCENGISGDLIKKMQSIGYLVSVDDFGSGYSSLYLLNQISVDILKLDRALLIESEVKGRVKIIIGKIVEMANELNMKVICEGVETEEQTEFLMNIGCNYAQGYYYCKPMPMQDFIDFIQ